MSVVKSSKKNFDIPEDLIHIILKFYVFTFLDLLKLRTIDRTWQRICDNSILWLKIDLSFCPPREYVEGFIKYKLSRFPSRRLDEVAITYEERDGSVIDVDSYLLKSHFKHCHRLNVKDQEITFPQVLKIIILNKKENLGLIRPNEIRQWIVPIYSKYCQLWKFHIHWRRIFLNYYEDYKHLTPLVPFFILIPILTLSFSIFYFQSVGSYSLGFRYLYFTIFTYFPLIMSGSILDSIYYYFFWYSTPLNFTWQSFLKYRNIYFFIFLQMFAILSSLFLIEKNLTNPQPSVPSSMTPYENNHHSFDLNKSWCWCTLPLWTYSCLLCALYFLNRQRAIDGVTLVIVGYFLFLLPAFSTIVSLSFDNIISGESALFIVSWIVTPVIVVAIIPLTLVPAVGLLDIVKFWRNYVFIKSYRQLYSIRLIFMNHILSLLSSLSGILAFTMAFLSFADTYNQFKMRELGIPLTITGHWLLFFNCCQIFLMFFLLQYIVKDFTQFYPPDEIPPFQIN